MQPAPRSALSGLKRRLELSHGMGLVVKDRRILRQAHDVEGLFDGWGQATEAETTVDFDHLLDDLDEDRNPDGVDDLGACEVEEKELEPVVDELVGGTCDLLAALVIDVTLRVDDRHAITAIHGQVQALGHRSQSPLSAQLAHHDGGSVRSRVNLYLVHEPPDDLEAPTALALGLQLIFYLGLTQRLGAETDPAVADCNAEFLGILLAQYLERHSHFALPRVTV